MLQAHIESINIHSERENLPEAAKALSYLINITVIPEGTVRAYPESSSYKAGIQV